MFNDKRITETEQTEILRIAEAETITGTKITWEKAEEIAIMLNEVDRMNKFKWLKERGELIDLNSWINSLRFHRAEMASVEERANALAQNALAQHAKNIASHTLNNATNQEDIDRGVREMNAANALARGDISGAFGSLCYWRDR